ncbi:MAG: tetratricopeptide repeat protein, partial [Ktedonobacterales bacterium]
DLGRNKEALAALDRCINLGPQMAITWNIKGRVLEDLERNEEALLAYTQALALDPHFAEAWDNKIALLRRLGRIAEVQEAKHERTEALRP